MFPFVQLFIVKIPRPPTKISTSEATTPVSFQGLFFKLQPLLEHSVLHKLTLEFV